MDSGLHFEILVDRPPPLDLLEPRPSWSWRRLRPGGYPVWEQIRLPMYLARHRPAILHSIGNTAPVLPAPGTKLLLTVHDLIFFESWHLASLRQRLGRIYRRLIVPAAVRRADWILTDSQAVRDQLVARFPDVTGRISVVGMPVAAQFFDRSAERPFASPPYLVAFSAIDPRKNTGRVVEAFGQLRRGLPESQLVLVGAQGRLAGGRAEGIRVLNYIEEGELMSLLRSSRGLVYASLREGFGVPILEAMALGVPVITSNREPMRELAAGAALLVDPENVDSIRDAMLRVLTSDADRRRLAGAGRTRAEDFRSATIARTMLEIYQRLLA